MNKNAFINAACALLGAGGRGFVKALAFVALGAFCAPVESGRAGYDPKDYGDLLTKSEYESLRAVKTISDVCTLYGGLHSDMGKKCYIFFEDSDGVVCDNLLASSENKKFCVLTNGKLGQNRISCLLRAKRCPKTFGSRFRSSDSIKECAITLPQRVIGDLNSFFADIRKDGVLDYIKSKSSADKDSAIRACRVVLAALDTAVISSDSAMGACRAAKEKCPKDSYCPYKDSDYESELKELENFREPLPALAEEAKKCIKDTENFLNPAPASE